MKLSLDKETFLKFTSSQLNNLFPDNKLIDLKNYSSSCDIALDRIDNCFKRVTYKHYFDGNQSCLNHLHADQYLMYLWFLSKAVNEESGDLNLANKLYYLNKSLHGFDCMYNTALPDIFLVFHGVGTMLGKASYSDFFVALQGVTIGSHKGNYPIMGKGVSLTAHSSIIGKCNIGDRVSVSSYTSLFETDLYSDNVAFREKGTGNISIRQSDSCYAQQFFNVKL